MNDLHNKFKNLWEKQKVICVTQFLGINDLNISEDLVVFFQKTGMPLITPGTGQNFLPFTYLNEIKVKDKDLYLLGDCSPEFIGTSFIGLEKNSEVIYQIRGDREKKMTYGFVNQSLYQFLECLYHYNIFCKKYDETEQVIKEDIKESYEQLKINLTKIDSKAMSQSDYFWKHKMEVMEVSGYGDYLTGREIPTGENLRTFTQEEIDNMDLPF